MEEIFVSYLLCIGLLLWSWLIHRVLYEGVQSGIKCGYKRTKLMLLDIDTALILASAAVAASIALIIAFPNNIILPCFVIGTNVVFALIQIRFRLVVMGRVFDKKV